MKKTNDTRAAEKRRYPPALLAVLLGLMLIIAAAGCGKNDPAPDSDNPAPTDVQNDGDVDWNFYNERAESFITSMANGDFDAAALMFDETMKQALPVSSLQSDVWNVIVGRAGEFAAVHKTENSMAEGYYVCLVTSRHENSGVALRVVLSEDGLVSGLFIGGYPDISGEDAVREAVRRDGFTDYPVVIGEGTDFPLEGILSMPDSVSGMVPAVVLVHGSGPHDYDETIFANKPFRDIADYLAPMGIAVIRYDKRTFTYGAKMTEELGGAISVEEETIEDAVLAAELLKADPRIDENRVFIIGHSLGGMLAPRIHAEGGNFAGIISLAGSPRSLLDIGYDQQMAYIEEMPEGDEKTAALAQMETYDEQIEAMMVLSDDVAKQTSLTGGVSVYYFKEMNEHPVPEYVRDIAAPFLILQGSEDFQVYADKDYLMWQELLEGRTNAEFKLYEGLNHLFMPSSGGTITEYLEEYEIEANVDTQVLADIAEFIVNS